MSILQNLREMHPYRLLLLATLAAIVLVQVVAMVMVTQSQVRKAQVHYAQERATLAAAVAETSAATARPDANAGVMKVGYVVSR